MRAVLSYDVLCDNGVRVVARILQVQDTVLVTTLTEKQSWTALLSSIMGTVVGALSAFRFAFKFAERIANRGCKRVCRLRVTLPKSAPVRSEVHRVEMKTKVDLTQLREASWAANPAWQPRRSSAVS